MANGSSPSPALPPTAIAQLEQGNTIEAIKIVRLERDLGLKESKDLVDAYLTRPDLQRRLQAAQAEARQGFVRWLVIFLALAAALPAHAVVVTGSWKAQAGACTMVLEEEDHSAYHLRVFQMHNKIRASCVPSAEAFAEAFGRVMQDAAPFQKQGKDTVRLFLGRLIELPDLSKELSSSARQAREWNLAAGKPVRGDENVFVGRLLLKSDTLRELLGGLKPARINVEKVLVPSRDMVNKWKRGAAYPNKRVPYDCLIWVEIEAPR
jgi:hypothetical protein